ncbi:MAG: beta-ketoacyl-ACP reductase [Planctomycetota bacterium]
MTETKRRVAIVTGASRGIGRAIALRLARDGFSVVVNFRGSADAAEAVAGEIRALGTGAIAVAADVRIREDAERLISSAEAEFGRVDALVNNAGIIRDNLLFMLTDEDWDAVVDTSLKGARNCCRAALSPMISARSGSIVNVASISGLRGVAGQTSYSAAKAGMIGMTRSLAKEVGKLGVRVNVVAPGLVDTEMADSMPEDLRDAVIGSTALGRAGTPEEVASVVSFLISGESSYITGKVIEIDGGL